MDQEKIGHFIQINRKEKDLTQEQLAEELGVSQKAVSRWETGKNMPDIALIPEICRVLDVNIAELINGERYEGDMIEKIKLSTLADSMVSLGSRKRFVRDLISAVLAFIITLASMNGIYSHEFNVRAESTRSLETALQSYLREDLLVGNDLTVGPEASDPSAEYCEINLLESTIAGSRLIVLFEYVGRAPKTSGVAILEKGLFGKYRFCTVYSMETFGIFNFGEQIGNRSYLIAACTDDLPEYVTEYGVLGFQSGGVEPIDYNDPEVVYRAPYYRSPFLTVQELREGVSVVFQTLYYDDAGNSYDIVDISKDMNIPLGGSSGSTTGSMEQSLVYWTEAIILILGIIFIRYFLLGAFQERRLGKTRE